MKVLFGMTLRQPTGFGALRRAGRRWP